MTDRMNTLGLYLHIPFCRSKCLYCDFCSLPRPRAERVEAYVDALCRDLAGRAGDCRDYTVDTVYLGGGTPTLLSASQLERILDTVARSYHLSPEGEITAECNPSTVSRDTLLRMRQAGFNRLSMGLQSAHGEELKALGRLHSFADFCRTWEMARGAGFANLSADVMSGIPGQTVESYLKTLERLCALEPEHISAYGLTVEEGTPFGNMGDRLILPDEEEARQMYFEGCAYLESRGWKQYEISNFAKTGYESRHNLKYWNCTPYLGFGPAAYSDFAGARFGNSRDVDAYIRGEDITAEREIPTAEERVNEFVMLQMRLWQGINAEELRARFGVSLEDFFGERARRFWDAGLLRRTEGGVAFSREGMYVSNLVLSEILSFAE